ncbi:hypothetical protein [Streptomyces sp. TS71-3]|uniref:hypothetical protein n=1 Tax=Streptomyces sp. TS71-3 TaxID=2733862 RepID=UPI001B24FBE8|nr:hypothetical protein [Streptomyces sp. TS71-3]GHJ40503.1 hypothetical protein Sm713_61120 [Streptomyces sp. TS71-3]
MSTDAPDPGGDAGAGGDPDGGVNGTIGPWGRRIIGICTVITAIVGVSGLILGFWQDLFGHDEKGSAPRGTVSLPASPSMTTDTGRAGSAPPCTASSGHDITVRLKEEPTSSAAHLIATVKCAVGPGNHLSWVVRKDTGDPAHPRIHYTLRYDLGQEGPGEYPYDSILDTTAPGSKRTVSVVLMDDATYRAVVTSRDPDTAYVQLPSPIPYASNSVLVTTPG